MSTETLENMVWFHLMGTANRMGHVGAHLIQSFGITPPQYLVIRELYGEHLTQQELANRLLVTKGNISQMVKIMERDNLLVRESAGNANRLSLTAEAATIFGRVEEAHTELVRAGLKSLNQQELAQLHTLLGKIDHDIENI